MTTNFQYAQAPNRKGNQSKHTPTGTGGATGGATGCTGGRRSGADSARSDVLAGFLGLGAAHDERRGDGDATGCGRDTGQFGVHNLKFSSDGFDRAG